MNVLVLGATGATGRLVVESALAAGHAVTAFFRESKRMPFAHQNLRIIEGDVMDRSSLAAPVRGVEAAICTLGTMPDAKEDLGRRQALVPVCSVGTMNVLAAMPGPGGRLIVESSASVGESCATGSLGAGFIVKLALRQVMADKEVQEAIVRESCCNWTIVRPVKLTNKPARGRLKSGPDVRWNIASTATRADVAKYMVEILADPTTYRQCFTLKN